MPVYQRPVTIRAGSSYGAADQVVMWTMVHNALLALGLTQTADTGQWATMIGNVNNTVQELRGYRVYKMTDSLGDLYVRVEFWSGFNAMASIKLTIGFATDGAGNVVNGVSASAGNLVTAWTSTALTSSYFRTTGTFTAIRGDGFLFINLSDGGIIHTTGLVAGGRYAHPGISTDGGFGWASVGRPTDGLGVLQANKLAAIGGGNPSTVSTTAGNLGIGYTSLPSQDFMASRVVGQAERNSAYSAALVCQETALLRNNNPVVGRVYADYPDTGPLPLRWMGAMPTQNAAPHDTIEVALLGTTPKIYRHCSASGYPAFTPFVYSTALGSGRYLVPIVEDDGVTV